jgi:hypothetical protein
MKWGWARGLALATVALMSACGGGGGDGNAAKPPAQLHARDFYQVYVSQDSDSESLVLVDAADFSRRLPLGAVHGYVADYRGTVSGGVLQDLRPDAVFFVQNNAWWRVGLRREDSQGPVQVSSESIAKACGAPVVIRPTADSADGALLYAKAGPDDTCATADDVYRRIGLNDAPTVAPKEGPVGYGFIDFRDASGNLLSVAARAYGSARLYQSDLTTFSELPQGIDDVLATSADAALVDMGGMRRVDATGAVSPPLHEIGGYFQGGIADGDYFYFIDAPAGLDATLFRLALDGSSPSEQLWAPDLEDLQLLGETSTSIVLLAPSEDGAGHDLMLLAKSTDGTVAPVFAARIPGIAHSIWPHAPILIDSATYSSGWHSHAYRLDGDDTLTDLGPDTDWVGLQYPADVPIAELLSFRGVQPVGAFRVDDFAGVPPGTGATLKWIGVAGAAESILTQLDAPGYPRIYSLGPVGMGTIRNPDFSQTDVFSFDLDDGRFERHTTDTPEYESPLTF